MCGDNNLSVIGGDVGGSVVLFCCFSFLYFLSRYKNQIYFFPSSFFNNLKIKSQHVIF